MRNLFAVLIVAVLSAGCVSIDLNPVESIKSSIKAGKNIYDEAKLKKEGGNKLELTTQVSMSEHDSREAAEQYCVSGLKEKMIQRSPGRAPVMVSEKIQIMEGRPAAIIECEVVAFIWSGM